MTDIVERLRVEYREWGEAFHAEAADEIDRLRAVNADLLAALTWATKQIGILSEYIETPEALAKFDECQAAIARATKP